MVRTGFFSSFQIITTRYYFPAQRVGGFYAQRSFGQAVFTGGVVHSLPRYVPSFLSRIGFSIPTARRLSSDVANPRSRAFR